MKKEYLVPAMELTELELQGNILDVSVGEEITDLPGDHGGLWKP